MRVAFTKMHGLGNDFVILDDREAKLPALNESIAAAIADRRRGIGCDQFIVLEPSSAAEFKMRIFNSDGGEVEACGNAARAVALLHGTEANVETDGGVILLKPADDGASATVDMGKPRFDWQSIPLDYAMDTASMPVSWGPLGNPTAVNVGNPHVIFFVDDTDAIDLAVIGPEIEHDPLFPEKVNVNVAHVVDRSSIKLRVWERGAGLTRACGTGACATAVGAMRRGLVDRNVLVELPGGPLQIHWGEGDHIHMSGPATESFRGSFEWSDFAGGE